MKQNVLVLRKLGNYSAFLDVLVKAGCIKTYVEYPDLLLIKLKTVYSTTPLTAFQSISRVPRFQRTASLSFDSLKKLQRGNSGASFYVLNSDKGLLTSFEALQKKVGGKVLFQIT